MATAVTLFELVDLSVGTPEIGAVNYNCLHQLLHKLLEQLNLKDVKTHISSEQAQLLSVSVAEVEKESGNNKEEHGQLEPKEMPTSLSIDQQKKTARNVFTAQKELENRLQKVELEVKSLNDLPSNSQIFKQSARVSAAADSAPVQDMWSIMKIEKKTLTNEEGIDKLMSMMQDVLKEMARMKEDLTLMLTRWSGLREDVENLQQQQSSISSRLDSMQGDLNTFVTWEAFEMAMKGLQENMKKSVVVENTSQTEGLFDDERDRLSKQISELQAGIESIQKRTGNLENSTKILSAEKSSRADADALAKQLAELAANVDMLTNLINNLSNVVDGLPKQLPSPNVPTPSPALPGDILAQLAQLKSHLQKILEERAQDDLSLRQLQKALLALQEEHARLTALSDELVAEKNVQKQHIERIYKQVEDVNEVKADKAVVKEEFQTKADKVDLDNKVTRELFDTAQDDLNTLMNDLLAKLTASEESWQQACNELTTGLETKLNKLELDKLREYLERRLKLLEKRSRPVAQETTERRVEDDAAGVRRKLKTRFNCISCDREIDLANSDDKRMQTIPERGFPPKLTARPHQVYELEQIRQQGRRAVLPPINPNTGFVSYTTAQHTEPEYQTVARACGGEHTLTQPHRRPIKLPFNQSLAYTDELMAATHRQTESGYRESQSAGLKRSASAEELTTEQQADESIPAGPVGSPYRSQRRPQSAQPALSRPASRLPNIDRSKTQIQPRHDFDPAHLFNGVSRGGSNTGSDEGGLEGGNEADDEEYDESDDSDADEPVTTQVSRDMSSVHVSRDVSLLRNDTRSKTPANGDVGEVGEEPRQTDIDVGTMMAVDIVPRPPLSEQIQQ